MNNNIKLKTGSLIKLISSRHNNTQYVPALNVTTKLYVRLPIGSIGMILETNNGGSFPPEKTDLRFLYEDKIYETYHTFVEPL